jgi:exopolyphosphatase/guanosine-5'-triphosphate,3'-diphosphate pyrophosphatase
VRWISVQEFSKRLQIDEEYASQVAKLALQIFDGLVQKVFPKLEKEERSAWRELLHAATVLHEAGKFLSYSRYHRHSAYIIANSSLMGFTQNEKMLMGLIARFHRKGIATNKSDELGSISQRALSRINFLAGILRLATALNRTRQNRVKNVAMNWKDNRVEFVIRHQGSEVPEVEMHMASRETAALKKVFNLDVTFKLD